MQREPRQRPEHQHRRLVSAHTADPTTSTCDVLDPPDQPSSRHPYAVTAMSSSACTRSSRPEASRRHSACSAAPRTTEPNLHRAHRSSSRVRIEGWCSARWSFQASHLTHAAPLAVCRRVTDSVEECPPSRRTTPPPALTAATPRPYCYFYAAADEPAHRPNPKETVRQLATSSCLTVVDSQWPSHRRTTSIGRLTHNLSSL